MEGAGKKVDSPLYPMPEGDFVVVLLRLHHLCQGCCGQGPVCPGSSAGAAEVVCGVDCGVFSHAHCLKAAYNPTTKCLAHRTDLTPIILPDGSRENVKIVESEPNGLCLYNRCAHSGRLALLTTVALVQHWIQH
jgi:hypothetical protein